MNRYTAMMVCAFIAGLVFPGVVEVAEADYVIYLRDGKQYVVDTFWIRGDLVGPLRIEKNRVAVIHDRETGENIILNRFHTTQAYEAFLKSQEAQGRLRGKEPTCGEAKEPAKANYKIVQQDDLSYQGVGKVVMLQFRIHIAESMSENELCHICKDIVGRQKQPYNAIRCWFYLPDSNTSSDYTAGQGIWAPNGNWEDAGDVRTGDYSQHTLVTLAGKRGDHIARDETPIDVLVDSLASMASDGAAISLTEELLERLHTRRADVKAFEDAIVISYVYKPGFERHITGEIRKVLEAGYLANKERHGNFTIVHANVLGEDSSRYAPKMTVTVGMRDVEEFLLTNDVERYMKMWVVTSYDHLFLPATTAQMDWKYVYRD